MWGMLRICSLFVLVVALACPAAAQTLAGRARVIDGDTLELAGERVRLFGIDAPEAGQRCTGADGRPWDCGAFATTRLRALAANDLHCVGAGRDRYRRLVATCHAGGRDIAAVLVAEGAAFAYRRYSQSYVAAETRAESARRGLWAGRATRPDAVRAYANAAPGACAIKGNISDRGRLYHLPGSRVYGATKINPKRGERWFCTETEARAAGWVAASR